MPRKSRITAVVLLLSACAITLLLVDKTHTAVANPNDVAITPTPYEDPFSATLAIIAGSQTVLFAEELLLTVELDVVEGCQYPVFELTLYQISEGGPIFSYIDPPAAIIGPPMTFPVTFRLRAIRPGEIYLRAQTFGERFCDDYWNWHYLWSNPLRVAVRGSVNQSYLPFLHAP